MEQQVLLVFPPSTPITCLALQRHLPHLNPASVRSAPQYLASGRPAQRVRTGVYHLTERGQQVQRQLKSRPADLSPSTDHGIAGLPTALGGAEHRP